MLTASAAPESGPVPSLGESRAGNNLSKLSEESESVAVEEGDENDVRHRSEYRLTDAQRAPVIRHLSRSMCPQLKV